MGRNLYLSKVVSTIVRISKSVSILIAKQNYVATCVFKVACSPVFSKPINLESKLIDFFIFVNF